MAIDKVIFYLDDVVVETRTVAPFDANFTYANIAQGTHSLKCEIYENNVLKDTKTVSIGAENEVVINNLLLSPSDFGNANWLNTNAPIITTDVALAPDGTMTADSIQDDRATNYEFVNQIINITAYVSYKFSVYVKKKTSPQSTFGGLTIGINNKFDRIIFDEYNGTFNIINSSGNAVGSVVDDGDYYKFSLTSSGNDTQANCIIYPVVSVDGSTVGAGAGIRTFWNAEFIAL